MKKKRRGPKVPRGSVSVTHEVRDLLEWRKVALIATVLSFGALTLYASLAARDVMFGDGPELTTAAILNGVAHPPGYPLWIMLGHLATLLPVGSLPFRVNLTACVYHALTVGVVYVSGYVLTRRHIAALFAALVLAIGSRLFVTWSLQAEVFSLNDLFAAAIVLACLLWLDDLRRWYLIVPLGALFGLGLSNQQSLILLAPLPLWVAWCGRHEIRRERRVWGALCAAATLLLLGFVLPYLHTLVASQRLDGYFFGAARTPQELLDVIDRHAYGSLNLAGAVHQGGTFLERIVAIVSVDWWPYVAVLAGCVSLLIGARFREFGIAVLLVAVPLVAFSFVANLNVKMELFRAIYQRFGLLPVTALAPFSAPAVAAIETRLRQGVVRSAGMALALCTALIIGALELSGLSLVDAHGPRMLFRDISFALPSRAVVFAKGDAVELSFEYFQSVEHWRPDIIVLSFGHIRSPSYAAALRKSINVPSEVTLDVPPMVRRDMVVDANPSRAFYTVGDLDVDRPGPKYHAIVGGIASHLIPWGAMDERRHYVDEVQLESAPDYADISTDRWRTNGFGEQVRGWYAAGFLSTGLDAGDVGDSAAAHRWNDLGQAYSSNRFIAQAAELLHSVR